MRLLLDLGNSALKWATSEHGHIGHLHSQSLAAGPPPAWRDLPEPTAIGLSSVAPAAGTDSVIQWCQQHWRCPVQRFRAQPSAAGVRNAYPRPQDLGSDRWMALIAAHQLRPGTHCIVDAGSAITIDLLSADGQHQGGYISPGYRAMLATLQANTDLTPPDHSHAHRPHPGHSTADCIRAGINSALIGLIETVHRNFDHGRSQLILTGGDAPILLPQLPDSTLHIPELVLTGIDTLLRAAPSTRATTSPASQTDPTP